jgi:hypothetical protein
MSPSPNPGCCDVTYCSGFGVIDARRTLLDSCSLYLSALAQAQIDCSRLGALVGQEPK